ncbi:YceG-like family protein [compost metagenome]
MAAVNPADTQFLFFVSRNDGTHIFSEDYKAHNNAVRAYQIDRKARQGKSWRDLQKREQKAAN